MENRQERTLKAFYSVLNYLDYKPIEPEPPLVSGMRKSLETSIAKIRRLSSEQEVAKRAIHGNVSERVRRLRRDHMMPLVRIAKPLLAFAPNVERVLRVPHARANAYTVATAALKMADALKPHAKLLASAGCSREYLREFRKEASDLALVARNADSARQRRSTATQALATEFKKGMQTVSVIEGLVMLHHGSDKSTVGHWKNRRRVSARIGRPRRRKQSSSVPPS